MALSLRGLNGTNFDASTPYVGRAVMQHEPRWFQSQTGTVVAATWYGPTVIGATATLLNFQAQITETIATGADRTVTIALAKSTGGGAFTSVSSNIVFNSSSTLLQVVSGTFTSQSMVVSDQLRLVVTVAGSTGNQALGLVVTVRWGEDPS